MLGSQSQTGSWLPIRVMTHGQDPGASSSWPVPRRGRPGTAERSTQPERVTVTVHGHPSAIQLAPEDLERLEEAIAVQADNNCCATCLPPTTTTRPGGSRPPTNLQPRWPATAYRARRCATGSTVPGTAKQTALCTSSRVARRTKENLSSPEIMRCLKRYIARRLHPILKAALQQETLRQPA